MRVTAVSENRKLSKFV